MWSTLIDMKYFIVLFSVFCVVVTALPLIDSAYWWIRIFDFPRVQIAFLCLVALCLTVIFLNSKRQLKISLVILLLMAFLFQFQLIIKYTPLIDPKAKESSVDDKRLSFSILMANVLMKNEDYASLISLIEDTSPDIILLTEPNQKWTDALKIFDNEYPFSLKMPLENTYGMILLSKLPLLNGEINFLVEDDIPSVFAQIELPSGDHFDFFGLHPEPPKPGTDTYERDTELLLVGKIIGLTRLEKLRGIGSDHFPMLVSLTFEPDLKNLFLRKGNRLAILPLSFSSK
jgi:endonuclease/exonuclease/phosphatase (EEP) superfamily protein YafD